MTPEEVELQQLRRQLSARITDECRSALLREDKDVLNVVWRIIKNDCGWMLERLGELLRTRQVRIMIQHALRRLSVKPEEAEAQLVKENEEAQTWFAGMDTFRGVSDVVSYLKPDGTVDYMLYRRSHDEQRDGMDALDRKQEVQDAIQRERRLRSNQLAKRMVAEFGDLPLQDLVKRWVAKYGTGGGLAAQI
jgi:hypothetical protein